MPLPPLPQNNTDRAFLQYTSMGRKHELIFRQPSVTPQADIIANAQALANALKAYLLTTDSFYGLRHQDSGSNLSFPLAFTPVAGTTSATPETEDEAKFMSVVGRSLGGYRTRLTLFTPFLTDMAKYRIPRISGNDADIFLDAVEAIEPAVVAVDGGEVVWLQYANFGFNSYIERKMRDQ